MVVQKRRNLLLGFPDEIVLNVLQYLDVPELHSLTKTCHYLRTLSSDPLLHRKRLNYARSTLSISLSHRPSLEELTAERIYMTRRQVAQRSLSRSLTTLRLKRKLATRPGVPTLIERGVLPASYYKPGSPIPVVAPGLLGTARDLEKEKIKDTLRRWVEHKRSSWEQAQREGKVQFEAEKPRVRDIARRYGRSGGGQQKDVRWGKGRVERNDPPRANVLGLRRFYEKLAKGSA